MTDTSLLAPAIIAAALVIRIRTALGKFRHSGSAREQWVFASDRRALGTGAAVAAATLLLGCHAGPAAAAWAPLIAALTIHLSHRDRHRP
ncbi:hypothetical protein [Streptomyces sp. WM6386]|uniref:hypothetical protein n=1 Tax=Streptomyces sp. WM6386 TaxID=1415558 RepID=UPI0006193C7A|nr:hypothetical protein [Streptomyces sp. WM6386]KKD07663.1 hypothetical protein TN53_12120 [Streptomyces sp. WM6386]